MARMVLLSGLFISCPNVSRRPDLLSSDGHKGRTGAPKDR